MEYVKLYNLFNFIMMNGTFVATLEAMSWYILIVYQLANWPAPIAFAFFLFFVNTSDQSSNPDMTDCEAVNKE